MSTHKDEKKRYLVCDGSVSRLEGHEAAEMQARLCHQARSTGVGA